MKRRVADIIIDTLIENEIFDCFAVVGGGAMHLDNAFAINKKIKIWFNHHEQACAIAAEGYAKLSGKLAAVCVTAGPGSLNTLNGIESAYVDNVPMIVIAGYPRYSTTIEPTNLHLRCRGVQEFDAVSAVQGFTKYAKLIKDPLSVKQEIQKGIDIAMDGRRGPVWFSIPLDVQGSLIDEEDLYPNLAIEKNTYNNSQGVFDYLTESLQKAKRPCILFGSGIRSSNSIELFKKFINKLKIPVVGGCQIPDVLSIDTEFYYGQSGVIGPRCGNFILQNSDLIIVLGNSLSTTQTGFNQDCFAPSAKIIMVDVEVDEMKKPGLHVTKAIFSDLKVFLAKANEKLPTINIDQNWLNYCNEMKTKYCKIEINENIGGDNKIAASKFWTIARPLFSDNCIIALGNSTSVVGGILSNGILKDGQRVLANRNCGSMGWDLPAAMGAAIYSGKEVVCATGDGSIMMNLQELQTIKQYNLPIKIIIFSNDGYDALRSTWKKFFDGHYVGCDSSSGVSMPSFRKLTDAFDMPYMKCESDKEIEASVKWLLDQKSAAILEIIEKYDDGNIPRIQSKMNEDGTFTTPALHDMFPFLSEEEMKNCMKWNLVEGE